MTLPTLVIGAVIVVVVLFVITRTQRGGAVSRSTPYDAESHWYTHNHGAPESGGFDSESNYGDGGAGDASAGESGASASDSGSGGNGGGSE